MSKYIDLAERLHEDSRFAHVKPALILIRSVLNWLDEHPDQVPGRTMTRDEYDAEVEWFGTLENRGFDKGLEVANITVDPEPDPKPTNAEKWEKFICDWMDAQDEPIEFPILALADYLDTTGVQAPEVNDE